MKACAQKGMTLIEVLVAMAVLTMIAGAVLTMTSQSARSAIASEERMLARILVDNEMVETLARPQALEESVEKIEIDFANRRWDATRTIIATGVNDLYRIDVAVSREGGGQTLARAATLSGADQ